MPNNPPRAPRILLISTSDIGGGAEAVAWTLFKGLQRRGATAWMAVGEKKSADPNVIPYYLSPHIDYRPFQDPEYQRVIEARRAADLLAGREDFNHPYAWLSLDLAPERPDLVYCSNLHGGYFDLRALAELSARVPVFLGIHDCWTMTGHCAYTFDCERWATGCGECPHLDTPPAIARDATRHNWLRKQSIYAKCRLRATCATEWIRARVERSILAPALIETRAIPYAIDLSVYRPASQSEARAALGLAQDDWVLCFAAVNALSNPFKDYATVRESVRLLAGRYPERPIRLLCVGESGPGERFGNAEIRHLPFTPHVAELARCFQAADVYLHAARSEVFGLVIAEALACGTPVVATSVGGIPEAFEHERHGFLVPPADPAAMAQAAGRLLADPALRADFGKRAAAFARSRYDQERMIDAHYDWFQGCLGG